MNGLSNKHILLGVTGGIAAYKSPDLVRRLREAGADVRVVMSTGAKEFVTPLSFQATSGNPVHTDLLDEDAEAGMGHIELARWADAILIAPASANRIAALAQGFADDLLSTVCLASEAPLFIAPAMNRVMWSNAAVQSNIEKLQLLGATLLGPGSGDQACGETGSGRMLEPTELRDAMIGFLTSSTTAALSGKTVLITAGPTQEALDPVRYISNHSSGKMGFAIAQAAEQAGASVTLIAGPVEQTTPRNVNRLDVISAQDMHAAVMQHVDSADVFIGVAAVADYRASDAQENKIKKSDAEMTLTLARNPDILADVASLANKPFTVGFAAETQYVENYAREKLEKKKLDMIAANLVGKESGGFKSDTNSLFVLNKSGDEKTLTDAPKNEIARQLIELIAKSVS
ncbi:MAG: bifunctional phosphopantothenoylcysteine decarboxylase/phosphopantothenate--cysteine ligase CoaBC [Pseudomonadota bacterium]